MSLNLALHVYIYINLKEIQAFRGMRNYGNSIRLRGE